MLLVILQILTKEVCYFSRSYSIYSENPVINNPLQMRYSAKPCHPIGTALNSYLPGRAHLELIKLKIELQLGLDT